MKVEDILNFVFAGNATFTLQGRESRFTFRVRQAKNTRLNRAFWIYVLRGPDNRYDYTYIGHVFHGPRLQHLQPKFNAAASGHFRPAKAAFSWLMKTLNSQQQGTLKQNRLQHLEDEVFIPSGRCGRCSRKLTVPESVRTGIGPECAKK